jgi:hypothetical protein
MSIIVNPAAVALAICEFRIRIIIMIGVSSMFIALPSKSKFFLNIWREGKAGLSNPDGRSGKNTVS